MNRRSFIKATIAIGSLGYLSAVIPNLTRLAFWSRAELDRTNLIFLDFIGHLNPYIGSDSAALDWLAGQADDICLDFAEMRSEIKSGILLPHTITGRSNATFETN